MNLLKLWRMRNVCPHSLSNLNKLGPVDKRSVACRCCLYGGCHCPGCALLLESRYRLFGKNEYPNFEIQFFFIFVGKNELKFFFYKMGRTDTECKKKKTILNYACCSLLVARICLALCRCLGTTCCSCSLALLLAHLRGRAPEACAARGVAARTTL